MSSHATASAAGIAAATLVDGFLALPRFAVVGASTDTAKFGNKVLRKYIAHRGAGVVTAVNPSEREIEGVPSVASVKDVKGGLASVGVSVVTPPKVTQKVLEDVAASGGKWMWCQPGSEFPGIVERAKQLNVNVIANGACVLVELDRRAAAAAAKHKM